MVKEIYKGEDPLSDLIGLQCTSCKDHKGNPLVQRVPIASATWVKHETKIEQVNNEFREKHKDCK
jgi:hypothetical protein